MSDHIVGVDLGGSNVRVALSDLDGHTVASCAAVTAQDGPQMVVAQVAGLARELARSAGVAWSRIASMAVGVPGVVHLDGSGLRLAPNLPPLDDFDVVAALGKQVGVPVTLDNDVNLATLAEQRHGLGAGVSDFVLIGVGTGVGMGIVASGCLQRGATGGAGEIGFMPFGVDPFDRANQAHGPLEETVGGAGVVRRYAECNGDGPAVASALEVYDRRTTGDPHARAVLDDQARATAVAVVCAASILDPALVVFGGGIGSRADFVEHVHAHVARLTPRPPAIAVSSLGERGGLIGAVELARALADGHEMLATSLESRERRP